MKAVSEYTDKQRLGVSYRILSMNPQKELLRTYGYAHYRTPMDPYKGTLEGLGFEGRGFEVLSLGIRVSEAYRGFQAFVFASFQGQIPQKLFREPVQVLPMLGLCLGLFRDPKIISARTT